MYDYPKNLAPELDDGGGVVTPFEEWWPCVKSGFPNVPDIVAREWLHRHWGGSSFRWVPPHIYQFSLENFPSKDLPKILNRTCNFEPGGARALDQGKFLCGEHPERPWNHDPLWLVEHMKNTQDFPAPIIVLDNLDNHVASHPDIPDHARDLPQALILVEGHTRHQIGLYLQSTNRLKENVPICRLTLI